MSKFYLGNELIIDPDVKLEKVLLTQAEYDALTEKDDNKLYIIIDAKNPLEDIQNKLDDLEKNKGIILQDSQLIYYTSDNNKLNIVDWAQGSTPGGSDWPYNPTQHIVSHEYNADARYGIITFDTNTIPDGLFISQPTLLKVDMADNIIYIGAEAFCNCTNLKEIRLSNTLKAIGYAAFYKDSGLESIYIPDSIVTMHQNPDESDTLHHGNQFMNCESLNNVRLSKNMTEIPGGCFWNCYSLSSIYFPNSIEKINGNAFTACRNINNIVLGSNVKTIGQNVFSDCISIKSFKTLSTKLTSFNNDNLLVRAHIDTFEMPSSITECSAVFLNVSTINYLIFPTTFTHFTSGHNAAATIRNIDFSGDSVTNFPRLNNQLETVILRKNALVTGLDELIPSSIITTKLQIYVPTDLIKSYKSTYSYLSDYFFKLTGDSFISRSEVKNIEETLNTNIDNLYDSINDTIDNTISISEKGTANGVATLDERGKVPSSQLPSYVDDIIDVYAVYAENEIGQINNIVLFLDSAHKQMVVGESGKIYQNVDENQSPYQFRWTGTTFALVGNSPLIIGTVTGTAYDGAKGANNDLAITKILNTKTSFINNINTTESNISIDYKSYKSPTQYGTEGTTEVIIIPSATTESAGVMSSTDKTKLDNLPTSDSLTNSLNAKVDKVEGKQLSTEDFTTALKTKLEGLNNYNDSDIDGRITQLETNFNVLVEADPNTAINSFKEIIAFLESIEDTDTLSGILAKVETKITDSFNTVSNYTVNGKKISSNPVLAKEDVGLSNVDNTSDMDKPISTAQQAALQGLDSSIATVQTNLDEVGYELANHLTNSTNGLNHIPANGSENQILAWASQGKATWIDLNTILPNMEDLMAYGVEWDVTVADPHLTRIGNMSMHRTLPIQSQLKGCIAQSNQVMYWLNEDDWRFRKDPIYMEVDLSNDVEFPNFQGASISELGVGQFVKAGTHVGKIAFIEGNSVTVEWEEDLSDISAELTTITQLEIGSRLDGYDGTVRVYCPGFYIKSKSIGNKRQVWISTVKIDDSWTYQQSVLIDAYRSTVLNTVPENMGYLSTLDINSAISVVNTATYCRGGNNNSMYDSDANRSLLGKPRTTLSRSNMRTYAEKMNSQLLSYDQYKNIFYWLYVIEYANFNSQEEYNADLTSEGFRQGGLGAGVTNLTTPEWSTYNNSNPITPCGYGNKLGNNTGLTSMQIGPIGSSEIIKTLYVPRWRGFDNPFGDIWTNLDGILIDADADNHPNGMDYVYTCQDPSLYFDTLGENTSYEKIAEKVHIDAYTKQFDLKEQAHIIPNIIGGNTTQYKCDYNVPGTKSSSLRSLLVGGSAYRGGQCGLGCLGSHDTPDTASTMVGVRTVSNLEFFTEITRPV